MNIKGTRNLYCKICELILSSAFGVALITENTPKTALPNIFLEIGLMIAYGKEILILTDSLENIPSDLSGKEVIVFKSDEELKKSIEKWSKEILKQIKYWNKLARISLYAKDYEKTFEYLKRAVMFGDFEDALSELMAMLENSLIREALSERLISEIKDFLTFTKALIENERSK